MKIIYAVVDHLNNGQVDLAYTSKDKAYVELKKIFKEHIEDNLNFYEHCDKDEAIQMKKLLNSKFNSDIVYSISDLLNSSIGYTDIDEDFYILPITLNPDK